MQKRTNIELANHLGNVLNVVTDRKLPVDIKIGNSNQGDGIVDYFTADVVSYSDYLPFGQVMPNRSKDENQYRYGFNGMEKDDELKGIDGGSYTTEFRQYDPRIGRWLSLDPMMAKYPHQSPYAAFDNNPIYYKDPKGAESESTEEANGPDPLKKYKRLSMKTSRWGQRRAARYFERKVKPFLNKQSNGTTYEKRSTPGAIGEAGDAPTTTEATRLTNSGPFNSFGFRAVLVNDVGEVQVVIIGIKPEKGLVTDSKDLIPVWPKDNAYGQKEGSQIIKNEKGDIVDGDDPTKILIPIPKGVDKNDGLYKKGEVLPSGNIATKDTVLKSEIVKIKDSWGMVLKIFRRDDVDITKEVKKR